MSLQCIKLITFDATNTLLKFRVPPWQYYAIVGREYGFKGSEDEIKNRLSNSFNVMSEKYPNFGKCKINWPEWWKQVVMRTFDGLLPVNTQVDVIANRLIEEFKTLKCWSLAPGADQLIYLLQNRKMTLGVISNFDPRLYEILQNLKIFHHFNFILTSYETDLSKPDKKMFDLAREKCKGKPKASECLHIGDDIRKDYIGAKEAGWHALLVTDKEITEKPPAVDHVFKDLNQLCLAISGNFIKL